MKLKLNKKKMKNLSKDNKAVPAEMTPMVAGGVNRQRLTLEPAYTCGIGYTCPPVF